MPPARVIAPLLILVLLPGCVQQAQESVERARGEVDYLGLVVGQEAERADAALRLERALRGHHAGEVPREEALDAIRDARALHERHLAALRAADPPARFEAAHPHALRSYERGIESLDAAERCVAERDAAACVLAREKGDESLRAHEAFLEAAPIPGASQAASVLRRRLDAG